ncbi:hypothetical protein [Brevibacillus sp. 179-C9.3 HS]|uniref:hypothetical protein n=1 Tax=unclassified Brevibacillus TaxID=2684853 RepID=UPI0039A1DD75
MTLFRTKTIGTLLLASVVGLTGVATISPEHASSATQTSQAKKEEPPKQVQASFEKVLEIEPLLKDWQVMGKHKTPMSHTGNIRGVWTYTLTWQTDADTTKGGAEMQFDSTTGTLLHFVSTPYPTAKVPTQDKDYYQKRGQEILNQILGTENAKQFPLIDSRTSIGIKNQMNVKYEVGGLVFIGQKEQIQISIDSDGRLKQYNRIFLPNQQK